jgi:hypothetical protein
MFTACQGLRPAWIAADASLDRLRAPGRSNTGSPTQMNRKTTISVSTVMAPASTR